MRGVALLVLALAAALPRQATANGNGMRTGKAAPAVTLVTQAGLEHPDHHEDGFVLADVFVHHLPTATVHRRQLSFKENPHLDPRRHGRALAAADGPASKFAAADMRKQFTAIDASATLTREKVRGLAKLNFANADYDWDYFWGRGGWWGKTEAGAPDAGDIIYEDGVDDAAMKAGTAKSVAFRDAAQAELDAMVKDAVLKQGARYDTPNTKPTGKDSDKAGTPNTVARRDFGIACLKFQKGEDVVLVFRDTESSGDYVNIEAWMTSSIVDNKAFGGMTQTLKREWTEIIGWGETEKEREAIDDTANRAKVQAALYGTAASGARGGF